MITGNTLSKLRQLKGFKQNQLAKKIGVTQQALSKMEQKEKIDTEKFKEVLTALKINSGEWEQLKKVLPPPQMINKNYSIPGSLSFQRHKYILA